MPIIATKLYIPSPRPKVVLRPRLIERLNEGLHRKLTLISASAGFGKPTLVSQWLAHCGRPTAWLSLEEGENDPIRFLTYFVTALQTIAPNMGSGVLGALQSPQPPPIDSILTALLNEITTISNPFILVLDDYHVIDAQPVADALVFLLEHLPPQMQLVIATREDPHLPLARLRVRDQLTELRVTDLRFTPAEATEFLNRVMDLSLSSEDIILLETRTEGWIAGLQLAAISMQGHQDVTGFIQSFTGSHHFVLDYLIEEVLQQQPESIQTFLLHTSILDRLCGPLCDAVMLRGAGHETLEYLAHANLFIVPLDNERQWYRYHHLFADLLRQRLQQDVSSSIKGGSMEVAELHLRASEWYEDHGLEIDAFHHAVAANNVEHATRLVEGDGMPLHFRGAVGPVLSWLNSLRASVLDTRPSLWVMYASALLMTGQTSGIEQKLQAAELSLLGVEPDDKTRDLVGHIASIRATLAVTQHQVEAIITQSRRALEYLHPANLPIRTATIWTLGHAYQLQGDRVAASQAYREAITSSEAIGHLIITLGAAIGLGNLQEADNYLDLAVGTYKRVLELAGDPPLPVASEAYLGLARIFYEWNDLDSAKQYGEQSMQLAHQLENTGRFIACEVFLARLKLSYRDVAGSTAILDKLVPFIRLHNFAYLMPEIVTVQVLTLLQQGNLEAAVNLAQKHDLPISQARVHLAQGDTSTALTVLGRLREQVEAKGWKDEQLKVMVLLSVVLQAHGEKDKAVQLISETLKLAEPGGFIRIFVDEGIPMVRLLSAAAVHGIMPEYTSRLLAAFEVEHSTSEDDKSKLHPAASAQTLIEPLTPREIEVLQLIEQGLSNREISERLFLALSTVKGHNQIIFGKLQVKRRTEALVVARELGLL